MLVVSLDKTIKTDVHNIDITESNGKRKPTKPGVESEETGALLHDIEAARHPVIFTYSKCTM